MLSHLLSLLTSLTTSGEHIEQAIMDNNQQQMMHWKENLERQLQLLTQEIQQLNQSLSTFESFDANQISTMQTRLQQLVDNHTALVRDVSPLTQGLAANNQLLQQALAMITQNQQMLQVVLTNIIPEQNISRRNHNRLCHENDLLMPIFHEPTGQMPTAFPATKADLGTIDQLTLDQLLAFYNLSTMGSFREKHLRFAAFVGID